MNTSVLKKDCEIIPLLRAVAELNAWEAACEFSAAGDPRDGGALIKEVHRVEGVQILSLDHADLEDFAFALIGDQVRGKHLHQRRLNPNTTLPFEPCIQFAQRSKA